MNSNESETKFAKATTALTPMQTSPNGTTLVGRRPRSFAIKSSKNRIIVGKSGKISSPKLTRVVRPVTKDSTTRTEETSAAASESQTEISMTDFDSTANSRESIIEMISSAHPNAQYFELLAEERRVALAEALKENEKLWKQVRNLRREVIQYRDLAERGENYAQLLRQILELADEESIENHFSS